MKNKYLLPLIAITSVISLSKTSSAQENITITSIKTDAAKENFDNRWYIAPTVSYVWSDTDRETTSRNDYGLGLGVGKVINKNINLELKGFYNSLEHTESKKQRPEYQWDIFGISAEAQYYFNRDKISPYLVAALGATESKVHSSNEYGMIGELGIGAAYKINDKLSLRSDVRYRYNNNYDNTLTQNMADEYNDMIVNVGFVIPLGSKTTAPAVSTVSNDSDNDGVKNSTDKCPDTKIGVKVNQDGCAPGIVLEGVNFNLNSSVLTNDAEIILNNVAQEIKAASNKEEIEIRGYSSSEGNPSANLTLSQSRAQAVVNYLAKQGVENPMVAKGYGSSNPIADNSSKEGKLKNRRVEMSWK